MATKERRQKEHEQLRARILAAARELAQAEGWRNVTLRKIADKIEYTHPALYAFFKSKDELLLALLQEGFRILQSEMEQALAQAANPHEGLRAVAQAYLDFARTYPELYQAMYGLDGVAFGTDATFEEGLAIGEVAGRAIAALDSKKRLTDRQITDRVYLVWSALHGLTALTMGGRIQLDYAEQLHKTLVEDIFNLVERENKE
jgi:AcrR family transcriptional regulator